MARAISHRRKLHRRTVRALNMPTHFTGSTYLRAPSLRALRQHPSLVGTKRFDLMRTRLERGPIEAALPIPSPRVHVLPDVHPFSRGRYQRERVLSGEALAVSPVRPTADLKRLYYTRPDVMVCVRRKQRREVLAAFGKLGGKHKRPVRTPQSYIVCR